jgi:site-specific recombinase XerD
MADGRDDMRGMGRIFKRSGSAYYWLAYCVRGKEIRESSGETDPRKAEKKLRARLDEVGADRLGVARFVGPKAERVLIGELLELLEADYRIRRVKAWASFQSHVKPVRAHFGLRRAVEVELEDIDRYIDARRAEGKADATINRETQLLGQAFRLGVRTKRITSATEIRHLRENNARQVFIDNGDFEAIVNGLPQYLQDFMRLKRLIAWRKGELTTLPWTQVDRSSQGLWLRDSKNGRPRLLVLPDPAWTIIERRWAARQYMRPDGTTAISQYVFHHNGLPIGDCRKAWATACRTAGLRAGRKEGLVPHDLRRTGVRNMRRAGVTETVAMAISGHRTRAVFDRYNITSEDDLRDAVAKTADYLKAQAADRRVSPRAEVLDGRASR